MGHMNSVEEHYETLKWANEFEFYQKPVHCSSIKALLALHQSELRRYFALSVLGQSKSADPTLVDMAQSQLFRIRVQLEKSLAFTLNQSDFEQIILEGNVFGASKKQGVSIRMPLWTCEPTSLCANRCYAHDTLDAAPASVLRGAINGLIAERYENGSEIERVCLINSIGTHIDKAIRASLREAEKCEWDRAPRIRFSHVGDIVSYYSFANELARQIKKKSNGQVTCVVYTRRCEAKELDPSLWVVNFTLDSSSLDRKEWVPEFANTVFSAFDGVINEAAYVNFLEHHRWSHCNPKGMGVICPATLPETTTRTCDSLFCNRCFVCEKANTDQSGNESYKKILEKTGRI